MRGIVTRLLVASLLCLALVSLASAGVHPRKFKKYNPAAERLEQQGTKASAVKVNRSPRQVAGANERRQYYPCVSCFRVGSKEMCTTPFCPDNYQCDRSSKRCHKKANIRGKPEPAVPEEEAAPPAAN